MYGKRCAAGLDVVGESVAALSRIRCCKSYIAPKRIKVREGCAQSANAPAGGGRPAVSSARNSSEPRERRLEKGGEHAPLLIVLRTKISCRDKKNPVVLCHCAGHGSIIRHCAQPGHYLRRKGEWDPVGRTPLSGVLHPDRATPAASSSRRKTRGLRSLDERIARGEIDKILSLRVFG
jgi:hypothetical protein